MIDLTKLPKTLKRLRLDHGLTQYRIAKITGMSPAAIHAQELGKVIPSLLTIMTYAELYGLTVSELLGETDGKEETN